MKNAEKSIVLNSLNITFFKTIKLFILLINNYQEKVIIANIISKDY